MRGRAIGILAWTVIAVSAGCGNLSHPLSDDGPDKNNPNGGNPGTLTINAMVGKSILVVGDTTSIVGTFNGAPLTNNGSVVTTSSDTNIVHIGGLFIFAKAVGSSTITVSYGSYSLTPPITISVVAK
jgi:hypothetical protein